MAVNCAVAQEVPDALKEDTSEWHTRPYNQSGKIYNGLFLTPVENPALTGFDRQLVFSQYVRVDNTAIGNQGSGGGPAFFELLEFDEIAFAGKRKNLALSPVFSYGNRFRHSRLRTGLAMSYSIHLGRTQVILGGGGYMLTETHDRDGIVFPGMVNPYSGGIGHISQQTMREESLGFIQASAGILFVRDRFMLGYSFRYEPNSFSLGPYDATGLFGSIINDDRRPDYLHNIFSAYHISLPSEFTLSPALRVDYDSFRWNFSPMLGLTWRDRYHLNLSVPVLDRVVMELAMQFWDRFRISAGAGIHSRQFMREMNGLAYAGGSIRYLLPIWR